MGVVFLVLILIACKPAKSDDHPAESHSPSTATTVSPASDSQSSATVTESASPSGKNEKTDERIRLAVLYFENNSTGSKEELAPLAKGLCDMMIAEMSGNKDLNVVERTRIEEVLKELKLTQSGYFDKETTQQLGKLLGVQYLIFGSYFDLFSRFRIDARIVKVETGEIIVAAGANGDPNDFDLLEKDLVKKLIPPFVSSTKGDGQMENDDPGKENRQQKKATVTLRGAVSYGTALEKSDRGDKQSAIALLRDVVESNPDFSLAKRMLNEFER